MEGLNLLGFFTLFQNCVFLWCQQSYFWSSHHQNWVQNPSESWAHWVEQTWVFLQWHFANSPQLFHAHWLNPSGLNSWTYDPIAKRNLRGHEHETRERTEIQTSKWLDEIILKWNKSNWSDSQCLKITYKVSFNIASEASYINILSGQKLIKKTKSGRICRILENPKLAVRQCYQKGQF